MQSLKVVFSHVIFGLLAIGAVLLYMKACTHKTINPPKTHVEAETRAVQDTIKKYITLMDTLRKKYTIEVPDTVVIYTEKYVPGKVKYIEVTDSAGYVSIIDSLTKEIISMGKVKDYLNASTYNLVSAKFSKDNSSFDLLNINGEIKTLKYRVDYLNYNYFYDGEGLRSEKKYTGFLPKAKLQYPKAFYTTSNLSASYDPFNKIISTHLDYSVYYGRLGLFNRVGIESATQGSSAKAKYDVGLTFRLK